MNNVVRRFTPGTEWLYIKIYTGVKTADLILQEGMVPLLQELKDEGFMKKWFFIRYQDPRFHVRFRFELADSKDFNEVLSLINAHLKEYIDSGEISELILDTYQREIERYGENTIEQTEFLFWKSSMAILYEYLEFDDEEKIMLSLFYIDTMLENLGLTIQEKLERITRSNFAYKQEFNADKGLNSQLDKKYRAFHPRYIEFLESDAYMDFRNDVITGMMDSEDVLKRIVQCHPASAHDFFHSIFHMHINRMFISNQRLFEMIVYDYLFRYYKSLAFQSRSES